MRYAATALIATGQLFPRQLTDALARVRTATRQDGELNQLAAIKEFAEAFEATEPTRLSQEARIDRDLVEFAWMRLFEIYYWFEDRNKPEA